MGYKELRGYALNRIIKDYAKLPQYLPLPCHMEHGWNADDQPLKSELATEKPLMIVFSKRAQEAWKKKSKIPVAIMGMPFIHYKNIHHITQKPDAKGTVVFPCHSTYFLKHSLNTNDYCRELKKLPKKFHPLTICLFWLDFIDKADIYRRHGFKVVTAGYKITNSPEFVKKFYDILSSHKYATSDNIGTHTFYAVDLNIPFFLSGDCSELINKECRDPNIPERTSLDDFVYGRKARKLFSTGPITAITKAQAAYVVSETGIKDCLKPKQMNKLFRHYLKKDHYGIKVFIPYVFTTLWAFFLFNGPWIKSLMTFRKRMTDEKRSRKKLSIDALKAKLEQANIVVRQIGVYNFLYFGFHYINNALHSTARLKDSSVIQNRFENKSGFEIGGPSNFFMANGPLPIYPTVKSLDNINFHKTTVWTDEKSSRLFSVKKNSLGRQYIADATDLSKIPKKIYDFFLSCNVLEHVANPLLSIQQALKLLSNNGLILLVVPKKESNFDRKRPVTKFSHILNDYNNHITENDLTHLPEILKLHDVRLDPAAKSEGDFKKRSKDNATNRCLHHHVFDKNLIEDIFKYFNLNIINNTTIHTDYIILAQKKTK